MIEFRLPDLGEGITEGDLVRWLVKPGDRVTLDQAIAEVQTDKAVVELPSPAAGTIARLNVAEGQVVPVETLLLTIDDSEGAAASATAPKESATAEAPAPARDVEPAAPASHRAQAAVSGPADEAQAIARRESATDQARNGPASASTRPQSASFAMRPALRRTGPPLPAGSAGPAEQSQANGGRWTEASVAPQRRGEPAPRQRLHAATAQQADIQHAGVTFL